MVLIALVFAFGLIATIATLNIDSALLFWRGHKDFGQNLGQYSLDWPTRMIALLCIILMLFSGGLFASLIERQQLTTNWQKKRA